MTKPTVRFWHYHIGAVLIKLRAGETVHHSHGGPTDEGWHRNSVAYSFDGETVTCEWCADGADCDGRMTRGGTVHCRIDQLQAGYHDQETGERFPKWSEGETHQRDYAAEAMNY